MKPQDFFVVVSPTLVGWAVACLKLHFRTVSWYTYDKPFLRDWVVSCMDTVYMYIYMYIWNWFKHELLYGKTFYDEMSLRLKLSGEKATWWLVHAAKRLYYQQTLRKMTHGEIFLRWNNLKAKYPNGEKS